jgi:pseudo-rSAM protein
MIFGKSSETLFYNTLSGQYFKIRPDSFLTNIINRLQDSENGYCIEISEEELKNESIDEFIRLLRGYFCGDIIDRESIAIKPFSLYPVCSVINGRERLSGESDISIGEKILDYLHVFTLQITGKCGLSCPLCSDLYRQISTCSVQPSELDIPTIENILIQLTGTSLKTVDIVGGNPLSYLEWQKLLDIFQIYPFSYNWYVDYRLMSGMDTHVRDIFSLESRLNLIIQDDFDIAVLKNVYEKWKDESINLYFHICSEIQYGKSLHFCEENKIDKYVFTPVYTTENKDFFEDFVFMDEESIVGNPVSKKTIFANMNVNKMNFGKMTVLSNGEVYANRNFAPLGNIKNDSLHELLVREMQRGDSWFRIRDQQPCIDCVYQWLCPSPSNYELVIGKANLCNIC